MTGGKNNKFSRNPISLLNSIVNVTAYIIDNDAVLTYCDKEKFDIIQIDVPNISFTDFFLKQEQKNTMYKIGYNTTMEYYKNSVTAE